jgi:hypothetical protein
MTSEKAYMFGDNMARIGYGGQAAAMRGFPNSIGVPTKHLPGMSATDFFSNDDYANNFVMTAIKAAFSHAYMLLAAGVDIVIPADGLGTGLAQLAVRSPFIFKWIENAIAYLESEFSPENLPAPADELKSGG